MTEKMTVWSSEKKYLYLSDKLLFVLKLIFIKTATTKFQQLRPK